MKLMSFTKKVTALALSAALALPATATLVRAQSTGLTFGELSRSTGRTIRRDGQAGRAFAFRNVRAAQRASILARQRQTALLRQQRSAQTLPTHYAWMSPEIVDAWAQGYQGQGTRVTLVDDFSSSNGYRGNLGTGRQVLRHGEWVRMQAGMIAPSAALATHDFASGRSVALDRRRLNTLNLSYGMFARAGFSRISWSAQESSILSFARRGSAVVVKAAGNDAVAVGATTSRGLVDYLARDLIGAQSAIFAGALDRNGTPDSQARLTSYSNFAGDNPVVQQQFLSVGVRGDLTGLNGTSYAAPIISGYAAVLGSKFRGASATQITSQLLQTARTDTILGYDAALHGRGEASITRALAPFSIR